MNNYKGFSRKRKNICDDQVDTLKGLLKGVDFWLRNCFNPASGRVQPRGARFTQFRTQKKYTSQYKAIKYLTTG